MNRHLSSALVSWAAASGAQATYAAKLRRAAALMTYRSSAVVFAALGLACARTKLRKKAVRHMTDAVRYMIHSRLARGFRAWQWIIRSRIHLELVLRNALNRLLNMRLSRAFESWFADISPELRRAVLFFINRLMVAGGGRGIHSSKSALIILTCSAGRSRILRSDNFLVGCLG